MTIDNTIMRDEKILIVEDEMIISATIEETLNKIGYNNIEIAFNANKAVELMTANSYDVVLMDIKLGKGPDGIDVIEAIKRKKDVSVIYVTGNSDTTTLNKAKTTLPGGFIVKPITETDLKVQLELVLYREKLKKIDQEEYNQIDNLYTGDLSGMVITLNLDGNILSMTPHIYKITGKHSYDFVNKKIAVAGLEKEFYDLLSTILHTVKNTAQRSFYGTIYSPYLGQRMVSVSAVASGFFSYQLRFTDMTYQLYETQQGDAPLDLVVISNNQAILNGFKSIGNMVKNVRVAAEMENLELLKAYMKSGRKAILLLDVNLEGLDTFLKEKTEGFKKILMSSPVIDAKQLAAFPAESYEGSISKTADDSTIMELFDALRQGNTYYDKALNKIVK